jgi:hypothetical protein
LFAVHRTGGLHTAFAVHPPQTALPQSLLHASLAEQPRQFAAFEQSPVHEAVFEQPLHTAFAVQAVHDAALPQSSRQTLFLTG